MYLHRSFLIWILFWSSLSSYTRPAELDADGWLADIPTVFRAGTGLACSMGATAAFITSAYILAHSYTAYAHRGDKNNRVYTLPPAFYWSIATGASFIAALFLLTETKWSKQI